MNNCLDRKQHNKYNDDYKKSWENTLGTKQTQFKSQQKFYKQHIPATTSIETTTNSTTKGNCEYRYDVKSQCKYYSFMYVKIQQDRPTSASKTKVETSRLEVISKETSTKRPEEQICSCPTCQSVLLLILFLLRFRFLQSELLHICAYLENLYPISAQRKVCMFTFIFFRNMQLSLCGVHFLPTIIDIILASYPWQCLTFALVFSSYHVTSTSRQILSPRQFIAISGFIPSQRRQ
ncbi:Hypothetical_protein [Hexamita inflata]|uniref:Hypothetical_protein n=1 Tax=Hexamita inflata TaxID=28002 RepID=A0AA86QRN1_9EUKA|nr:Hypothetical protein HINF_LOCUS45624 [Hexamita inflata]